jgi:hypothetical protein
VYSIFKQTSRVREAIAFFSNGTGAYLFPFNPLMSNALGGLKNPSLHPKTLPSEEEEDEPKNRALQSILHLLLTGETEKMTLSIEADIGDCPYDKNETYFLFCRFVIFQKLYNAK